MKNNIAKNICKLALITVISCYSVFSVGCSSTAKHESTGEFVDSTVLTTKVKTKLLTDKYVKGLPITVKTYKNVVELSGFVENRQQEIRAVQLARSVPGVESVFDALIIK